MMAATPSDVVAGRVIRARRQYGWTREQLAVRCSEAGCHGLTTAALTNIETGRVKDGRRRRAVTIDELLVFAKVFSKPVEWFLNPPACASCDDSPPAGFTCNDCGLPAGR